MDETTDSKDNTERRYTTRNQSRKTTSKLAKVKTQLQANLKGRGKLVVGCIVALIAIIIGYAITYNVTMPVKITTIETVLSLSSRAKDAPVQQEFASGEPIMLHFKFEDAKANTAINFEIKDKDGKVVKSGSTNPLHINDESANGERYVSIVNTANTALPVSKYTATLTSGNRTLKTIKFEIK